MSARNSNSFGYTSNKNAIQDTFDDDLDVFTLLNDSAPPKSAPFGGADKKRQRRGGLDIIPLDITEDVRPSDNLSEMKDDSQNFRIPRRETRVQVREDSSLFDKSDVDIMRLSRDNADHSDAYGRNTTAMHVAEAAETGNFGRDTISDTTKESRESETLLSNASVPSRRRRKNFGDIVDEVIPHRKSQSHQDLTNLDSLLSRKSNAKPVFKQPILSKQELIVESSPVQQKSRFMLDTDSEYGTREKSARKSTQSHGNITPKSALHDTSTALDSLLSDLDPTFDHVLPVKSVRQQSPHKPNLETDVYVQRTFVTRSEPLSDTSTASKDILESIPKKTILESDTSQNISANEEIKAQKPHSNSEPFRDQKLNLPSQPSKFSPELENKLSDTIEAFNTEIEQLKQQVFTEQSHCSTLQADNTLLQQTIASIGEEKKLLENDLTMARTETLKIKDDQAKLISQYQDSQQKSKKLQEEIDTFTIKLQLKEENIISLSGHLDQEKKSNQYLRAQYEQCRKEYDDKLLVQQDQSCHKLENVAKQMQQTLAALSCSFTQRQNEYEVVRESESQSRLRMITTLESTSQSCARQAREECQRLERMLGSMEATIGHFRMEHLEDKERLRQEQQRMDVLADHFQSQSVAFHESLDSNSQRYAQCYTAYMHDLRQAESRVHAQRQQLMEQERKFYEEQASFAAFREEFLSETRRQQEKLHHESVIIAQKLTEYQHKRSNLDEIVTSHEKEFQALEVLRKDTAMEKNRVYAMAQRVAEMAQEAQLSTEKMAIREKEIENEKEIMQQLQQKLLFSRENIAKDADSIQKREKRIQAQVQKLETLQKQIMNEKRGQMHANETIVHKKSNDNLQKKIAINLPPNKDMTLYKGDTKIVEEAFPCESQNAFRDCVPPQLRKCMEENWMRTQTQR